MALGALTLPSISTGFTSDSKSMVPISVQGMADKVQRMSPLETMQEVFFDIRDGIDNLAMTFSDKISGLNNHLAFRLETLNATMSNIGSVAAKDLDIEEKTFNIVKENEEDDDVRKSLQDGDDVVKSPGMLDTLKDSFQSFIDQVDNNQVLKAGLFGLLALALFTQMDKVSEIFTKIFKFIDSTITNFKELNKIILDSPSGYLGTGGAILAITVLFKTLRNVVSSVGVFVASISRPMAAIGRFLKSAVNTLSKIISPLLRIIPGLGVLGAFAKVLGPIGLAIQVIIGAFTFVNEFIKSWKSEGDLMTALGAGLVGVYDVLVGATLNLLADLGGFIVKKLGFEELGQKIADLDFNFDSVVDAIGNVFDKIKDLFDIALDGLKSGINFFLPKSMEFELSSEKKTTTNKIINEVESREYITEKLPPSVIGANGNDSKITTTEIEQEKLQSFNETYTDKIVKESSVMKEKQIELKKMEIAKEVAPPGNITVVTDAKKVSGDTVVSNNTNVTNHRVDSLESSSNALLNYFRV
jgi:hypothetical protein